MSLLHKLLIGSVAAGVATSPLFAQETAGGPECLLELSVDNNVDWRGQLGRGYEVFSGEESYEVVSVVVRHQGQACDYFLTGMPQEGGNENLLTGPYGALAYDVLRQPSGPSLLSPDYAGNELTRLHGRFPDGAGAQQYVLYVAIPPEQNVGGGIYSDQVQLRVFADHFGSPELMDQASFAITAPVADTLEVDSIDAGPGANTLKIDLGNLAPGVVRVLDFSLRSNAPIRVGANSQNKGVLAHQASAPGIPYSLVVGGNRIDLSSNRLTQSIAGDLSSRTIVPFRIEVEPNYGAAAGTYSDVLTITFQVDG